MNQFFEKEGFVALIGEALGKTIDPATATISSPRPSTGFGTNREAEVDITFLEEGIEVTSVVYYFKLDLVGLSGFLLPTKTISYETGTVHSLLPYIRRITGINFSVDDLEDLPPIIDESDLATFKFPLVAKPGSVMFKGSYELVSARKPHLQTIVTNYDLGTI